MSKSQSWAAFGFLAMITGNTAEHSAVSIAWFAMGTLYFIAATILAFREV